MNESPVPLTEAGETAAIVARTSYGKLIAILAARTRNVAMAEDALSEAFAAALSKWPFDGCPANPEAWLLTVARRKLIDDARRRKTSDEYSDDRRALDGAIEAALETDAIPDRRLALMFACAHPAIDAAVRTPLILQTVLGLKAAEIASVFLISPATMGQRLVRAKEKIRLAGIPFRVPAPEERGERLADVLDAIYAAFSQGWVTGGPELDGAELVDEALFLGRVAAGSAPEEPEALGLLALILHASARRRARRSAEDEFIPFASQDTSRWNRSAIDEAEDLIRRAAAFSRIGRYQLEAAIQSAHVHRKMSGQSNWTEIVRLYDLLHALTDSPVVVVNRALARAEATGVAAGLLDLDSLAADPRMHSYQPFWAARADLLGRSGDVEGARVAYSRAIGLQHDPVIRRFLERRRDALTER